MLEKMKKQRRAWCRRKRKALGFGNRRINQPEPPPTPNGKISSDVWLACALRYFSGGSPYDIMVKYGVSHTEMLNSVWYVVEVVNQKKEWYINYPKDHNEQLKIAAEFKAKSSVGFGVCAGAVDGILIWIHQPTLEEAKQVRVDQQKFFVEESTSTD